MSRNICARPQEPLFCGPYTVVNPNSWVDKKRYLNGWCCHPMLPFLAQGLHGHWRCLCTCMPVLKTQQGTQRQLAANTNVYVGETRVNTSLMQGNMLSLNNSYEQWPWNGPNWRSLQPCPVSGNHFFLAGKNLLKKIKKNRHIMAKCVKTMESLAHRTSAFRWSLGLTPWLFMKEGR